MHVDDDFFLPQLWQGFGGFLPGSGIFDRRYVLVLLVWQQLFLHVFGQLEVFSANRPRIASRQVGLARITEDEFAGQLGRVRVLGLFIDEGGVTRNHRAIGGDQHHVIIGVSHFCLVAQAIEIPDHADFHFTFFHRGDGRIGQ